MLFCFQFLFICVSQTQFPQLRDTNGTQNVQEHLPTTQHGESNIACINKALIHTCKQYYSKIELTLKQTQKRRSLIWAKK